VNKYILFLNIENLFIALPAVADYNILPNIVFDFWVMKLMRRIVTLSKYDN
jgi:hypothetical protein